MMYAKARSTLANLLVLMLALAAAGLVCEMGLRLLAPSAKHYRVLIPDTEATFDPLPGVMPGVTGVAHYVVNRNGIRGRDFGSDDSEYRILAVGGSTTECLYLDESEVWTFLVEEMLDTTSDGRDVWVGNVGRSGLTARDHVVEVKYLTGQYPRIDAILILVGINDLTVALAQGNDYQVPIPVTDPAAEDRLVRRAFLEAPGRLHAPGTDHWLSPAAPWYKKTATWQLLKRARWAFENRLSARRLVQDRHGQAYAKWRTHRREATEIISELPDLGPALEEYSRNLNAIADIAEERSIRLILLTQPLLWRLDLEPAAEELLWLGGIGDFQSEAGKAYYSVKTLTEAARLFNEQLRETCRKRDLECIDLARLIPRDTTVFFDDSHFTEKGSRLVAREVANYLATTDPFRPQ